MTENKRFKYRSFDHSIYDLLTGKRYDGNAKVTKLLNEISNKSDKNVELYYNLLVEHKDLKRVLHKYGIDSVKKLDLILFYSRLW